MQKWKVNSIAVSPLLLMLLAVALLVLPLPWVLAWLCAALLHELMHCLSVVLFGGTLNTVRMEAGGTVITAFGLSQAGEIISILAGPAAGIFGILFVHRYPAFAVCSVLLSLYNLLPLQWLDGGRALLCIFRTFLSGTMAYKVARTVECSTVLVLLLIGAYFTLYLKLGALPLAISTLLCVQSCKKTLQR